MCTNLSVVAVHTHVNSEQETRTKFRLQREFNAREEKRIVTPYFSRVKPCHEHGNSLNAGNSE
jgi:hypothetical protein